MGNGGSEEAHDYCWLTQNLWEAQDVWAWADGDEAKRTILKPCSRQGCAQREGTSSSNAELANGTYTVPWNAREMIGRITSQVLLTSAVVFSINLTSRDI